MKEQKRESPIGEAQASKETQADKTTYLAPDNDQIQLEENQDWIKSARRAVILAVSNLAVGLSFLTFLGFLVITSYIGSKSNLFTLNINPGYYIIAGINLLFGYLKFAGLIVQQNFLAVLLGFAILALLGGRLIVGILRLIRTYPQSKDILYFLFPVLVSTFCVFSLILTYVYGALLYSRESQLIGGAKVNEVILIFTDQELENYEGIITPDDQYPNRTAVVEMLFERTDGWMIRDKITCQTVFVKSDLIQAIVDPIRRYAATPVSPTPSATLGATPIQMPTTTPSPICNSSLPGITPNTPIPTATP